jgi:hypothetical protein
VLLRSFYNKRHRHYAHLVIDPDTKIGAVIDPLADDVAGYVAAAEREGARIAFALQTAARPTDRDGLRALQHATGALTVAPQRGEGSQPAGTRVVRIGESIDVDGLHIEVVANTPPAGPDVAYRIGDMLFTGWTVVRGQTGDETLQSESQEIEARARRDLDALLEAKKLTQREAELAVSYLDMQSTLGRPPSARELAETRGDLDRGGVHVLIHGIRRKQVALGQVPILLDGQMHKWLRGLQGEPDYTEHERRFLTVYLALVGETGRAPTGPDVLERLPEGTPIQWVRKRVHTIRRKQAAFGKPPLQMGREPRPRD